MTDLTTSYLGIELRCPIVASASPLTGNPAMWGRLEAAGVGAVVLPSLFEEQIEHDVFSASRAFEQGDRLSAEALNFYPDLDAIAIGPDRHVELVEDAVARLSVPVIASLNGTSPGGWVRYARALESAGAAAIELNVYEISADAHEPAARVEHRIIELIEEIKAQTRLPLAVKLGPWFTSLAHLAKELVAAGADGLVLFNRFYQPDIDLETLGVVPRLDLSTSAEVRLPLHWIGALRGPVGSTSLAASTGVHTGADVIKLILAGADVVMSTSALLQHGPEHAAVLRAEIEAWMREHEYESVRQMCGSVSRDNIPDPDSYDRGNYYQVLRSWHF